MRPVSRNIIPPQNYNGANVQFTITINIPSKTPGQPPTVNSIWTYLNNTINFQPFAQPNANQATYIWGQVYGTNAQTLQQIVEGLVRQNNGQNAWGGLGGAEQNFMNRLLNKLEECYVNAKLDLLNGLGAFCSYCGVRINDYSLAVEHCLPKSQFMDEMLNYYNFLLACPECNSSNKKANPTYAFGRQQANAHPPAPLPPNYPTYNDIKQCAVNYYIWPAPIINAAWGHDDSSFEEFTVEYWCNYNNNQQPWPFANQINANQIITYVDNRLTNIIGGFVNGQVSASQPLPPPPPPLPIISQFGLKIGYIFIFGAASNMGYLVGLNNYDPNNLHASDRRVFNRTLVWFHACTAFKQFDLILGLNLPQQDIDDLMDNALNQMYSTASESGFWEIWADLILKQGGGAVNNRLYQEFKAATINNNIYFPGTNPGPPANPYIP